MTEKPLIFYVEDDAHIRDLAAYALNQAGFEVRTFPDGSTLMEDCTSSRPDLVLLDIMLPGADGLELLRQLRADERTAATPVMMLTAKGTEYDTVCGLDAGADDYLAKPFGMMELISRSNALLRRAARDGGALPGGRAGTAEGAAGTPGLPDDISAAGIVLSPSAHSVSADGRPVTLTVKEFDLLRALMENAGRVMTRDRLLEIVWDMSFAGGTRTVDAHVKTLRQKLAEASPGSEARIGTVRGVGYVFRREEA